jgi:uncharacterized membrane protein
MLLAVLSAYCITLLIFRVWITKSIFYGFLVWNLVLAYIPFVVGKMIIVKRLKKQILLLWFLTWLLFLPNAPYIITDIFHLRQQTSMPIWFDLLLVISFSFNGVLLFFISVSDIYSILLKNFSIIKTWIITTSIFFLTGFGVYLGRFLRFNSWDILSNPNILITGILERILQPTSHPRAWGFTLGFGTLFLLVFLIFKTVDTNEVKMRV